MNHRPHLTIANLLIAALLGAGCQTRTFADPALLSGGAAYRGELTEARLLDPGSLETPALGASTAGPDGPVTPPKLRVGDRILLIQSGAMVPDHALVQAFGDTLDVTTYSGVPPEPNTPYTPIREAAARTGIDRIVCVQGRLQSEDRATRATWISWVPLLGWNFDDSELTTRLQLRFITVDVTTGGWSEFLSEPLTDTVSHAPVDRDLADTPDGVAAAQAQGMKATAFARAVPAFLQHHDLR